jgi:tetratricopeptide (TPR) repeat protein
MVRVELLLALLLSIGPAAAELRGNSARDPSGASEQVNRIESRVRANDPDEAVALGERAVEQFPGDAALWLSLGEAYGAKALTASPVVRLRFAKKCKAAFQKAVELDSENVDARVALFTYYFEAPGIAGGSFSLARKQADAIVRLDPARGHSALGALAAHEEDLSKAEREFRLVIEAEGASADERADAEWRLARVYEKSGKRLEAIAALKDALKFDPRHSQAKKDLQRLGEKQPTRSSAFR